jgi:hypothetical protein
MKGMKLKNKLNSFLMKKKNHLKKIVNMKMMMVKFVIKATIKCLGCDGILFCEECFSKVHKKRAYQNHKKTNFVNKGKKKKI